MSDKQLLQWMLFIDIAILAALIVDAHWGYCNYRLNLERGGRNY